MTSLHDPPISKDDIYLFNEGRHFRLYHHLGALLLFLLDALSFLAAAASEALIRTPGKEKTKKREEKRRVAEPSSTLTTLPVGTIFRGFFDQVGEGLAYVRGRPGFLAFLIAAAGFNFFTMPLLVLLPFYVKHYLGATARWYGFLLALVSLGAVVGFLLASTLRLAPAARSRLAVAVMLLSPAILAALGVVTHPWAALLVAFALGLKTGIIGIYLVTAVQATTPEHLRGRAMGVLTAVTAGVTPLGMALGGFVGDLTGKNIPLIAFTCAGAAFLLAVVTVPRRSVREFLAY